MGCDIHMRVESKPMTTMGWWPEISEMVLDRDYLVFGHLVAGHGRYPHATDGVAARGLPPDTMADPESDHCDVGEHTFSWLTPDEYCAAIQRVLDSGERTEEEVIDYLALGDYVKRLDRYRETRLVFGFDS